MEISNDLKAMGHPIRLKMVELLLQKQMCVRSLTRYVEVSEPTISVHLKVLKNAGSIIGEKKSYYIYTALSSGKALRSCRNFFQSIPDSNARTAISADDIASRKFSAKINI